MPTTKTTSLPFRFHQLAVLVLTAALSGGATAWAAHGPEKRTLIAVFPEDFPPVYQVTGNNVPTGFGIDVMEKIAARTKLHIVYRSTRTWAETLAAVREGRADLIPNLGITPERQKDFDFSRPLMRLPVSVFVRAEARDIESLDDLIQKGRTIASVRTNVAYDLLRDRTDKPLRSYNTLSEAFVGLQTGAVDALVYPDPIIEQFAGQLDLSHRIRRVGPPLAVIERAVAVRKGNAALLAVLNREIEMFVGTPRYQAIYERWHGAPPPFWTTARVLALVASLIGLMLIVSIIMRIRLLQHANAFNSAVLDTAVEGILTLNTEGIVRSANSAAERIFGRDKSRLVGSAARTLLTEVEAERLHRRLRQLLHQPVRPLDNAMESVGRRPGGETFPIRLGVAPTSVGGEQMFVCTVHDLTEQRRAEHEAEYLTDHDPVTGLLNQRGALLVLANLIALARRTRRPLTCLDLGLERFTQINDMYGRQVGDTLLMQVAEFLRQHVRDSDVVSRSDDSRDGGSTTSGTKEVERRPEQPPRATHEAAVDDTLVARLGGSRFLLVLPDTDEAGARTVADKLLAGLIHLGLVVQDEPLRVGGRVGIACHPTHGANAEELVSCAEIALRQAQEHPLDTVVAFNAELREQETRTHYWLQRLHAAIEERRLVLHSQPVLHIGNGTVHHYEALVRMQEPDGTLVLPGEFIPAAEASGLIARIDYRVLELAFSHLAGIEAAGKDISLAVNISGAHFGDDILFRWLARAFEERGVTPGHILFEITETTAVRNLLRAKAFMEPLKALGCRFALDDFGVGFTSFAHLRALPVDMVKIDGSFVRDLPTNPENRALVKAMTEVAHSLGKEVVAEYVESAEILAVLCELKVDYAQGFYIGRPSPEIAWHSPA